MISEKVNINVKTTAYSPESLKKDSWIVVLHANMIPPHIGLLIDGKYNSLTIKGQELDVSLEALLKTIAIKKEESIFIKLKKHPVFSLEYQENIFKEIIKRSEPIKQNGATCLSPVKVFFEEFYAVQNLKTELYFEFMKRLNENAYLEYAFSLNFDVKNNKLELPFYTIEELDDIIKTKRILYNKD